MTATQKSDQHTVTDETNAHLDGSGAMFNRIADRYDLLNRVLSLGLDRGWRRKLVAALTLEHCHRVLDLATGTGDVALAIARTRDHIQVVGIDPSARMLAVGQRKVAAAGFTARIQLVAGDAQQLALEDDSFDGCCMAFGIRNVKDRGAALREMVRVTRSGGRVVILELCEPPAGPLGALARLHVHHAVPRIGRWLTGDSAYAYLQQSMQAFPAPAVFREQLTTAGLQVIQLQRLGFGAATLFVCEA
ncbi:MAG TPA: bifunctional demethylmenaquinone methyltransferase/2-methoxy-6-polyprenyl-1,4-benzoquinol methylase UbiE [Sorangium sp.]|nr:bifunctional demethylmenaquinone methyltransferase/2-methoxy-6-polyprenyl-1,4-benzoquinol methylase UbiE [Sorangium sp.]